MIQTDVIIIVGSYAGNPPPFARNSYGFLTQDGTDPAEMAAVAKAQLLRYPTLTWIDDTAELADGRKGAFAVETAGHGRLYGRRLLLAIGVSDTLSEIEGLAKRWGRSVFHCPYCHGFELNQGRIGSRVPSSRLEEPSRRQPIEQVL